MEQPKKILPDLALIGSRTGAPTIDDITAAVVRMTGKRPSPEAIARGKAKLDAALAQLPRK